MKNLIFRVRFYFAAHLHEWILSQKCKDQGYPVAYPRILLNLMSQGEMNQRQLAQECLMQPSGLTRVIKDMENEGLVERHSRGWRGEIRIAISEKGKEVLEKLESAFAEIDNVMVEDLTEEERECMDRVMDKMIISMQKESLRMGKPLFNKMYPLENLKDAIK